MAATQLRNLSRLCRNRLLGEGFLLPWEKTAVLPQKKIIGFEANAAINGFTTDRIHPLEPTVNNPCQIAKRPMAAGLIPMSDRVEKILRQHCGNRREGWVFTVKRSQSGHLTTVGKRFRESRQKAGLPENLVLYCGRHDYGTRVLETTGNLAAVMKTMGHNDVKTAMQYQHPELEVLRQALNQSSAQNTATQ